MAETDCGQQNMSTATQDALYVNGKPVGCHRLADGNLYICRDDLAYFCDLIHVDRMTGDLCLAQYLHQTGTWHLFSQWKEYSNGYITGIISVYNSDMKYSPVRIIRRDKDITIDVYIDFEGSLNPAFGDERSSFYNHLPVSLQKILTPATGAKLVKEGIKKWENIYFANQYDSFGLDTVVGVTVNIHEKGSGESFDWSQNFLDIKISDSKGRSFVHYGKTSIFGKYTNGEWKINNVGDMHIFTHEGNTNYSEEEFIEVAAHEFGHIFGLGDAYSEEPEKSPRRRVGHSSEVTGNSMMKSNHVVTPNDIEMILLAWQENEMQYYADYEWQKKSKAIREPYKYNMME